MNRLCQSIILLATLSIIFFIPMPSRAETIQFTMGKSEYIVDGSTYLMDVAPLIKNGRTYIPVRYVAQALHIPDSDILWDNRTQKITILKDGTIVQLAIGSNIILVNGSSIIMDVPAEIFNGRTMLPIRFISEVLGASVNWDENNQQVTIFYGYSPETQSPDDNYINNNNGDLRQDTYPIIYTWYFDNQSYRLGPINVPIDVLNIYREKPHPPLTPQYYIINNEVANYVNDADSNEIISVLVDGLVEYAESNGYYGDAIVEFVAAFVQGLPYVSDSASTGFDEYTKYPVETLLERGGDCEDSAILTAVLLRELGYGTALLFLPDQHHVAVGVLGPEQPYGTYYTYGGKNYLYLETTDSGWRIGEVPDECAGADAYIVPLP
ncbi:MAG: stalk domain-containing protein [Bacillota bacterium]